jgi:hypothetical protein
MTMPATTGPGAALDWSRITLESSRPWRFEADDGTHGRRHLGTPASANCQAALASCRDRRIPPFTMATPSCTPGLTSSLANSTSDAIQRPPWSEFPVSRPSTLKFSGRSRHLDKWPLGSSDESLITRKRRPPQGG